MCGDECAFEHGEESEASRQAETRDEPSGNGVEFARYAPRAVDATGGSSNVKHPA